MAETLSTLSIISYAIAGVCLVLAIFFWFFFRISSVIGDLTGRTAKKSIARMRAANEKAGVKGYKESKVNVARGKLTGVIPDSDKLVKKNKIDDSKNPETGLLAENQADRHESETTGILQSETTGLLVDEGATVALGTPVQENTKRTGGKKLTMIDEVMLIHTDELIE